MEVLKFLKIDVPPESIQNGEYQNWISKDLDKKVSGVTENHKVNFEVLNKALGSCLEQSKRDEIEELKYLISTKGNQKV